MEINYFTPGRPVPPGPPLAPYRSATPAGALAPYLDAYTQPGDLVIDLFCHSPTLIHESVEAGRRALGLNVNRALLLAASLGLTVVERQEVEAAFTRMVQARKGPETLQAHVEGLYRTTCAACGATTVADAFIWERDGDAPVTKRYRCAACGRDDEAPLVERPTDEADRAAVERFESRGLSYWLLLDRAAPSDAPHRDRAATLLDLYTPRNLSAVSDLLLKSDGLTLAPPVRYVLDALLLDTLDRATSLRSPDAPASRPRRPQRPARYVEENVWRLFERALETWRETTPSPVPCAPDLDTLLAGNESPLAYLTPLSARQAGRDLSPACAALVVADPPRPDLALWHLTALWGHWLWGHQAGAPLATFLSRRRLDWDWLWRGLRGALGAVAPLLRPEGRLLCLFADENPVTLEALTLAVAGAGYELAGWGAQPPQMRLVWRFDKLTTRRFDRLTTRRFDKLTTRRFDRLTTRRFDTLPEPTPVGADPLSRAVAERAAEASLNVLRARGEPVAWPTLHAAIYAGLAESGLLARAATLPDDVADPLSLLADTVRSALDGAPLRQIFPQAPESPRGPTRQPLWWLDEPLEPEAASPLSDRVELTVAEILRELLAVTEADLHRRVCARFPGPETPDAPLVRLCLFSYGDEHAPGHWRLRAEDDLEARVAETDAVIADLAALGRRLGFEVALGVPRAGEWAVRWLDAAGSTGSPRIPYAFAVRTTAVLGDLLFAPPPFEEGLLEPETTPCLTLPGGRAVLVGYKLRHDPRLRQQVSRRGWQFLKFRHLRHLAQEVAEKQLDRYAFQAALGLDPIVEQVEAQMSLW
jgi:hypothetical protein